MSILVVAEHDNADIRPVTLNVLAAAQAIGGEVDVLIAGSGCQSVADSASNIGGVRAVKVADDPCFENALAENIAPLVVELAADYGHVLAAHTTTGKNLSLIHI